MSMTVIQKGQPGSTAKFRDSYLLHKLQSLSGILPIGLFLAFHLTANSYSLIGEKEFNTTIQVINYAPFVALLEIGVIAIPILFHAIYGLIIFAEMQGPGGNTAYYGYGRNWLYVLQRWSGVIALAYLLFHTYDTTISKRLIEWSGGSHAQAFTSISYAAMAYRFANPLYLIAYIIGITAACFHLGNGLFNFSIRWGLAIGKGAQKAMATIGWIVGLTLTVLGCAVAINFAIKGQEYKAEYSSLPQLIKGETKIDPNTPTTDDAPPTVVGSSPSPAAAAATP